MLLNIKTLNNENFNVDIDSNKTVEDLKNVIYETNNKYNVENQKLIFSGSLLNNNKKLIEYNIIEKSSIFLVCSNSSENNLDINESFNIESLIYKSSVETLCNLGFNKNKVVNALNASNNDIDFAKEILTSEKLNPFTSLHSKEENTSAMTNIDIPNKITLENIKELMQNPYILPMILNAVSLYNPQLVSQLNQNPQLIEQLINNKDFADKIIKLLNNWLDKDYECDVDSDIDEHKHDYLDDGFNNNITLEDEENINVLVNFGFDKINATQAYINCNKNKEEAANLLLHNY